MCCLNKLLGLTAIFILVFLTVAAPVKSAGLAYNWQLFVADKDLELIDLASGILPKKAPISKELLGQSDIEYLLYGNWEIKNYITTTKAKKSAFSKIKVTISSINSFLIQDDETYHRGKDEKISQLVRTLPSLLQSPSPDKALETLKLIEPRVNVGFEF